MTAPPPASDTLGQGSTIQAPTTTTATTGGRDNRDLMLHMAFNMIQREYTALHNRHAAEMAVLAGELEAARQTLRAEKTYTQSLRDQLGYLSAVLDSEQKVRKELEERIAQLEAE